MTSAISADGPRILPRLSPSNQEFWTGGSKGELRVQRCVACRRWVHPPTTECPACAGELRAEPVSGTGSVFTYTVNHQQFHPDVDPPYIIAIVELDEQDDLRIPTNLVNCDPDDIECGMRVEVCFEQHDDIWVPLFRPI